MDDGMDQKIIKEDKMAAFIAMRLFSECFTPRFLRTHFDDIEQVFQDLKEKE